MATTNFFIICKCVEARVFLSTPFACFFIMDGGQSHGPFLLIFNLRDQNDVLCKSQGSF